MTSRLKAQKKDFKRIEKEAKREFKQEEKAKRRAERDSRDPYRGSHGDRRSRSRSRDSRSRPRDYDERYDRERDNRERAPESSRDRYRDADRGRDAGRMRRRSRSKSPVGKQEVRSLGVADKTPPRNQDRYRLVRILTYRLVANRPVEKNAAKWKITTLRRNGPRRGDAGKSITIGNAGWGPSGDEGDSRGLLMGWIR
jgi:hypothetical protein